MALTMVRLTRNDSGRWSSRKVIPADARAAYGKREEKGTWDAGLNDEQAKAVYAAWLGPIELQIASLRAQSAPPESLPALDLSQRECKALAGRWYGDAVAQYNDNPGDPHGWDIAADELRPETGGMTSAEAAEVSLRITPWLMEEAAKLLQRQGLRLTSQATERLLADMAEADLKLCRLMEQRANGDWSDDPYPATFPVWHDEAGAAAATNAPEGTKGPTIGELFDAYVASRRPKPRTVVAWQRALDHLAGFLKHDDASRITKADFVAWRDHLLTTPNEKTGDGPRSAKTVKDDYLAAAKTVFQAAVNDDRLTFNPVAGVKVLGPKPALLRERSLTDDEAATILSASLAITMRTPTQPYDLARRWVPWLCAYTGARVNEITQLRKEDVTRWEGVWAIRITPEAGTQKSNEARRVPLHSHLIEQGFLSVVDASREGPLFYTPRRLEKSGKRTAFQSMGQRLADWVREIGVSDPAVQPNHGWRHRFKTVARGRLEEEARDAIVGHKPATVGARYGSWTLKALSQEVEKLPRYQVADCADRLEMAMAKTEG